MLKIWRKFSLILLSITSMFVYGAEKLEPIPTKFHGNWASDQRHCKVDHELNLAITSTTLSYWESSGSALSIVAHDADKLALIVDFSGEGDEWIGFAHFQISADGAILTDIRDPYSESQLVRYRCPA